jgi:tetratricopeptide (TPR) repeat protein
MAFNSSVSNTGSGGAAAREGVAAGEKGIAIGGNVEGGIHYHDAPITSLLRAIPPAPPAHFTGHESDLARLQQLLISGQANAIIALHGMGGIGKTSLALKLAEQLHPHFPGGVLWWSLGPNPDVITALDVWARHADPRVDLSAFTTAASRAEVVRPMLSKLDRLCVFIDDVWDIESFSILKSALPPGSPVLITTRDSDLAKSLRCRVDQVEALKEREAIEVLEKLLAPLNGYVNAGHEIVRLTEGLPLALELIAGIADSPSDLPSIISELRTKPILDVLNRGTTREQSMEVCFTMSYERLDENLQRCFCALGVFALAPFDRNAIAAVWGDKESNTVDKAIQLLERRSLLTRIILPQTDAMQENVGMRNSDNMSTVVVEYKQHALLRDYAIKLLNAPISSSVNTASNGEVMYEDFASRHATYYLCFAREQNWHAIEHVFDQIEGGWRWVQAHKAEQIMDYVRVIIGFLGIRGRNIELLDWLHIALAQASSVKDRKNEGIILNHFGIIYDTLGQKDQALDFYRQALDILREVGDRSGEGTTLNNLGLVYDDLGQKEKALDFYQQALDILREVGNRAVEGTILNNLGRV